MRREMRASTQRVVLVEAPPLLAATTWVAFTRLTDLFGLSAGYFLGFVFYWLFWCAGVPAIVLGKEGVAMLYRASKSRFGRPAWIGVAALGLPLVLGYGYAFPRAVIDASPVVVVTSAALAAINGPLEELLWRGAYTAVFPKSRLAGYAYPNVCFALWHLVPLSVVHNRAPGGSLTFVLVAGVVGLLWGWVARQTCSIRLTSLAHALFDFSGLGGRLYFR